MAPSPLPQTPAAPRKWGALGLPLAAALTSLPSRDPTPAGSGWRWPVEAVSDRDAPSPASCLPWGTGTALRHSGHPGLGQPLVASCPLRSALPGHCGPSPPPLQGCPTPGTCGDTILGPSAKRKCGPLIQESNRQYSPGSYSKEGASLSTGPCAPPRLSQVSPPSSAQSWGLYWAVGATGPLHWPPGVR